MGKIYHGLLVLLALLLGKMEGARILGVYTMPSPSHRNVIQPLFEELANRGHQVTVISPFPLKEKRPNYTDIPLNLTIDAVFQNRNPFDSAGMPLWKMLVFMFVAFSGKVSQALDSPPIHEFLNDDSQEFDLVILQYFFNEAVLGFAHKFKAPVIGIFTSEGNEMIGDSVGDPFPYAYIPNALLEYSNHMTFCQRLYNVLVNSFFKFGLKIFHMPQQEAIMRKVFNHTSNLPTIGELYSNTSVLFMNGHVAYSHPRPHVPNYIDIGGIHIKPPKKLPRDLRKFLDSSPDGVVYFSMGSNLKSSQMSDDHKDAFIKSFSKLKQKVLWKFEDDSLTNLPENVKIEKWLPQSDLLAHPNIRVFMTHGGLLSTQEAIYHGVPLIGIPIFADQKMNVKSAVRNGYAVTLDFKNITESSLQWALNEALNNPIYAENAKKVSKIFHDQPQTSMEKAIFWTEYVLRHRGARHLRSAALDLTWYEYYLLDVIAVLLIVAAGVIYVNVVLIRALVKKVFGSSKNKRQVEKSKKKN